MTDDFKLHKNTIGIDHGQGLLSIMIHPSRIDVAEEDSTLPITSPAVWNQQGLQPARTCIGGYRK